MEENIEVFTPIDNENCEDLWSKFIVLDTSFTTPPCVDKLMAMECLKHVKSADQSHSCTQAPFLDAGSLLMDLLDNINMEDPIVVENFEAAGSDFH